MQNTLTRQYKGGKISYTIRLIAFYYITTQLLSVLRATSIYNTSYIANCFRLFISGIYLLIFLYKFFSGYNRMTLTELVLIAAPCIGLITGCINGQFGRDYFSDFYTACAFVAVVVLYRRNPQLITKNDLEFLAKCELWATIISLLTYKVFPLIGYPIKSVGIVSNYLLFPLAFYLSYKNKLWLIAAFTILIGGKRGVMISAVVLICFFFIFDKKRLMRSFTFIVLTGVILCAGLYYTESPERVAMLPTSLQRVGLRFMQINPYSDYIDLYSDGRMDEIESALREFEMNPINMLLGRGNGFVYDVYHAGVLSMENNHNVHFTPVALFTRYGIIYTVVFYLNYLWLIFRATMYIRLRKNHKFIMCMTLFMVGTFVDQFTAFLPYADYQFMIFFGVLNGFFLYNYDCDEEEIYDIEHIKKA